jgi:Spy/CpxP family protein refolding chaperone
MRKTLLLALTLGLIACSHEQPPAQSGSQAQTTNGAMDTFVSVPTSEPAPVTPVATAPVPTAPVTAVGAASLTAAVEPSDQASQDEASEAALSAGHGQLLRSALRLASLTPSQRIQIQGLAEQKQTADADIPAARAHLLDALAGAVHAGNVSAVALAARVQALVTAIQTAQPTDRAVVQSLHAILTPGQRTVLANEVEERVQAASETGGEHGAPPGWLSKLELTHAQKSQVETNFRTLYASIDPDGRTEWWDEHVRLLEAFKGDAFVMSQVAPPKTGDEIERRVDHIVNMAKAATPVLTSDQREAGAALLRSWAARAWR